jgi:hypothetical protein
LRFVLPRDFHYEYNVNLATEAETMAIPPGVIEGTAKEIKAALAAMPDDAVVRLMVGRPSLSIIARKLQSESADRGMTDAQHDALMASLKNGL